MKSLAPRKIRRGSFYRLRDAMTPIIIKAKNCTHERTRTVIGRGGVQYRQCRDCLGTVA